ncbi:2OG-Fe(II) oxygenase [Microbulbifer taiwanensis]|uniref:2OG-Fe(II) oxygenase n=1 Tax=Microbulbifer taiwanensis TaxID=986746 RepID=UPI00186795AE|nr:2OG-Fe(II) oxygenase [Microbulbifer taiwanensis]
MKNLPLQQRIARIDWSRVATDLDSDGWALLDRLLTTAECDSLAALYPQDEHFRRRIVMANHNFGRGEYKYFVYPLPVLVAELRSALYRPLVTVANRWNRCLGAGSHYPEEHSDYLALCHRAGQTRPTPLLLQYGKGDFNCLHQDLYGEQVFPLQAVLMLSDPEMDFSGGEFVLTEQRPRMQSRAQVVPLRKGSAVIFAVHQRPQKGSRGYYRVNMRHGVRRLHSGRGRAAGNIFPRAT